MEDSSLSDTWKASEITHQTIQPHASKMDRWGKEKKGLIGRKEDTEKKKSPSKVDFCDNHNLSTLSKIFSALEQVYYNNVL